jgi:UDP-N-acetylglucosamine 2-epimerase (non-hydrolysing)
VHLEQNAFFVLTDSSAVREECCIFDAPNATIRDVTECPGTIEARNNVLSGAELKAIMQCVEMA